VNLLDTYRSILKFASLEADNDGYAYATIGDRKEPSLINGKRIVLPLSQHLRNPDEKQIFHPLSENIMRGESEIIEKLKENINIKLNYTFGVISQHLLLLATSPELHDQLTPDQTDALIALKDADTNTTKNFVKLMVAGIKKQPTRLFTNIYLKKGGTVRDKRYSRAGIVVFPVYNMLEKNDTEIFGVKLRVKDKETLKSLYQFVFPGIDVVENYNYGSDSNIAPYLDCLLKTASGLAGRLNDILDTYRNYIEDADQLVFDSDWLPVFDNLEALMPEIRRIPMQAGNEGKDKITEEPEQPLLAPMSTQQPMMAAVPQMQMQMPMMQPGMPAYSPYQPMQSPMQPYVKPEVKTTKRGLDFQSMKMANPILGAAPNPLQNQMAMQQYQQAMRQQQMYQQQPQYTQFGMPIQPQMPMMQPGIPQMYPNQPMMQPVMQPMQPMVPNY
jgi:hypothetical protein